MTTIDLNSDLGESFGPWEMGNDAAMIELATSVNIACGFHAGDADIMRRTVELAKARGVSIGAHPGYRDLHGFGRRPFPGMKASEIENLVAYQIGALQAIATAAGHKVTHVKAHGALSNVACEDDTTAKAIALNAHRLQVEMPISAAVDKVLHHEASINDVINSLLSRDLKRESH